MEPLPTLLLISDVDIHSIFFRHKLFEKYHVHTIASQNVKTDDVLKMRMDVIVIDDSHLLTTICTLCQKLKQSKDLHFVPILVISSNLKRPYWEQLKKSGVLDILHEPLEEEELLIKLAHADQYKKAHKKVDAVAQYAKPVAPLIPLKKRTVFNKTDALRIQKELSEKKPMTVLLIDIQITLHEKILSKLRPKDIAIPLGETGLILVLDGITRKKGEAFAAHFLKLDSAATAGLATQDAAEEILFPSLEEMIRVARQCLLEAKSADQRIVSYIR